MKKRLCLQDVSGINEVDLAERLRIITGWKAGRTEEREQRFEVDGAEAVLRCRETELQPPAKNSELRLIAREGIIIMEARLLPLREMIVVYTSRELPKLQTVVEKLCCRMSLIIAEPNLKQRLAQELGTYDFRKLPAYKNGSLRAMAVCHLPWQIYVVSKAWQQFLQQPEEKVFIRQLRVKLRRLRSTLSFFKPVLQRSSAVAWQNTLRQQGELLSRLRELDVALMTCEKIRSQAAASGGKLTAPTQVEELLQKLRREEAAVCLQKADLSSVTKTLAQFNIWLHERPLAPNLADKKLRKFISRRLNEWSEKLETLDKKYPDFHNMMELHQIRIKVKRFRYALQTLPEVPRDSNLLRRLKRLQDMLGFLHDDFINARLVQCFLEDAANVQLRYEAGLFAGWERAKAEAAVEMLPQLWEDFCGALNAWRKENL